MSRIEQHYGGPLDTIGDPFCETSKIQKTRLDWLMVAEVDQEYAGFLYWHLGRRPFFSPDVEIFAHIREVQVLEGFRGRGVGKKLVADSLQRLRSQGVQEVFLSTAETNHAARKMYEQLGFREFRKQIQYHLDLTQEWSSGISGVTMPIKEESSSSEKKGESARGNLSRGVDMKRSKSHPHTNLCQCELRRA